MCQNRSMSGRSKKCADQERLICCKFDFGRIVTKNTSLLIDSWRNVDVTWDEQCPFFFRA